VEELIDSCASLPFLRRFQIGDKDGGVWVVQNALVLKGYLSESSISGVYDEATSGAVAKYQQDNNLHVDGLAGLSTMQAMLAYLNVGF